MRIPNPFSRKPKGPRPANIVRFAQPGAEVQGSTYCFCPCECWKAYPSVCQCGFTGDTGEPCGCRQVYAVDMDDQLVTMVILRSSDRPDHRFAWYLPEDAIPLSKD